MEEEIRAFIKRLREEAAAVRGCFNNPSPHLHSWSEGFGDGFEDAADALEAVLDEIKARADA